ncbi:DUF2971 domain-containing protein [Pseudomonas wadenswilerensis]
MSLYHYTDVSAALSILEKRQIWMTDVRFLNDSKEFYDGVEFVQSAIRLLEDLKRSGDFMSIASDYVVDIISKSFERELDAMPKFVCSFSQKGDLLSQWRSYGNYAVEFDRSKLSESLGLVDCIYCEKSKEAEAKRRLAENLIYLSRSFSGGSSLLGPETFEVQMDLVAACLSFKNKHFLEESEVRSVFSDDSYSDQIQYRAKGGMLVPYVAHDFQIECVNAIHIGPMANQKLAEKSMLMFLEKLSAKSVIDGGDQINIAVVCSEIPYRAL